MFIYDREVSALSTNQVAYPVGQNKDSYTIVSRFNQDLTNGDITVSHELIKNWSSNRYKEEGIEYPEGTRFTEKLHRGTYQECIELVKTIVKEQGEWRRPKGTFQDPVLEFTI